VGPANVVMSGLDGEAGAFVEHLAVGVHGGDGAGPVCERQCHGPRSTAQVKDLRRTVKTGFVADHVELCRRIARAVPGVKAGRPSEQPRAPSHLGSLPVPHRRWPRLVEVPHLDAIKGKQEQ
jgi:hypothetical protein